MKGGKIMFDKKTRCYNGGNQHKFEPRYNERERDIGESGKLRYFGLSELRDFLTLKIYERDVCVWCGKTIKKKG